MRVGTCSVCGGQVGYAPRSGKADPHNEWRVRSSGSYQNERLCAGAGRLVEERAR